MISYKIKQIKGVTDLIPIYPYNDYGDFFGHNGITEEQYLENKEDYELNIKRLNSDYINSAILDGSYATEYEISIEIEENKDFDKSEIDKEQPLSSYKFLITDINE